MPKLFVISDMHSYYDPMIDALNEAGFDANNENHWLICCGDAFDRGPDSVKVMKYLRDLPRKVLVHGNHDQLLIDCCEQGYFMSHDQSNGTVDTIMHFGYVDMFDDFSEVADRALKRVKPFFDSMVNYFETENYIFLHSWVPMTRLDDMPKHYLRGRVYEFNPDWRNATDEEWQDAMWGNPFEFALKGLFPDKTIVCGHWHTSWARAHFDGEPEFGEGSDFSPYYYKDKLIGIDGCVAYSGKVNCLVLEDEFIQ